MNMTRVQFHGHLAARFGEGYPLDVKSPAEAVRALHHVLPGFTKYLLEHNEPGYRVVVEDAPIERDDELHYPAVGKTIHFVPAIAGAAGAGKLLLGAALIGASFLLPVTPLISGFAFSASSLALNLGISMALGGLSQMLSSNPSAPAPAEAANNQPSFVFAGVANTTAQGNPVPICYGEFLCGSQIIGNGLFAAAIP